MRRTLHDRLRWGPRAPVPDPTPADLAAQVWTVTYRHPMGTSLILGPVLAFDRDHALRLGQMRMLESGLTTDGLEVIAQPRRVVTLDEGRQTALVIEGPLEWQDRQERYADRQVVTG